jgi:selenocysteine lyase/cysteine desulfurase
LPPLAWGTEVVVPDDEFTSVLFPLLVAEKSRGVRLRRVAFGDLATAIGSETNLVAFSLTRSQDGEPRPLATSWPQLVGTMSRC